MFGGTGWLLTNLDETLPATPLIHVIELAGAVGITQLWNLDLRVYHQLLNATMAKGVWWEQRRPRLPQPRATKVRARDMAVGREAGPRSAR